jgi:hypothetical protein
MVGIIRSGMENLAQDSTLAMRQFLKPSTGYTGPGDIASGAAAWWGLRGYNAAYSTGSNPACDLVDQAGANPITINILSNGSLDVASINTWVAANSVTTIKLTKLYDQTGNANHVSQATLGNMPVISLSVIGSLPAILYNFVNSQSLQGSTLPVSAYPLWGSYVAERIGNTIANNMVIQHSGGNAELGFRNSANTVYSYAGLVLTATANDNSFHAVQSLISGVDSDSLYVDGSNTTGDAFTSAPLGHVIVGNSAMDGYICEAGLWGSDQTTHNSAMNSNQHTYWGF